MTPENGSDSPDAAPQRRYLPGDIEPEAHLARMLRVDHAGEYGARRIYEGQLAVLGKSACAPTLKHMHAHELVHLRNFEDLRVRTRVRPTLMQPVDRKSVVTGQSVSVRAELGGLRIIKKKKHL